MIPIAATGSAAVFAAVFAAGAEMTVPDPSAWAQYGPAGVSASIFAGIAWYFIKALMETLKLERERSARMETEIRELNRSIHAQYIPAITTVMAEAAKLTQVTAETTRILQEQQQRRDRDR